MIQLTYKEICKILNDKEKNGGKQRQQQLKRWENYYDVKKVGKFYYIENILSINKTNIIKPHKKYTTYIENILIHYLNKNKESNFTYRELFECLNIVNKYYFKIKYNIDCDKKYLFDLLKYNKIDYSEKDINLFFNKSFKILKKTINDSIHLMENKGIIESSKTFRLYKHEKNFSSFHVCNSEEIKQILDIKLNLMDKFDIKKIYLLNEKEKNNFYTELNKNIKNELGYDYCYESIDLKLLKNKSLIEDHIDNNKFILNLNIKNKLLKSKEINISDILLKFLIDHYI